jgi:ribokinase
MFEAYQVISIGDTQVDLFFELDKEEYKVQQIHHPEKRMVCFNYGDKLPVEKLTKSTAGNSCNVAVGSRRLGLNTAYVSIIGDDDEGRFVWDRLVKEKIDLRFMKREGRSNISAVINYAGERTIFVYHEPRDYKLPKLPKANFVYLTSMRPGWEKIIDPLADYLDKTGTKLAYQPGTYQLRAGIKQSQKLLDRCEVIFINKEEAALFTNKPVKTPIPELLTAMHRHGPRIVVITDGPKGSYASDSEGQYQLGVFDVPVVERTGCGDAFATGFMAALVKGKDVQEAMRWGSFESAGVLQQIGPQAGLLTHKELELYDRKYPDFTAKVLTAYKPKKGE